MYCRNALLAVVMAFAVAPIAPAQGKPVDAEQAKFTKLQTAYKAAKAKLAKSPKDTKVKKQFAAATAAYGTAVMTNSKMGPKDKYPGALRLYREALAQDPTNKEALENKKLIEDIYRSMGRPIPK